jgi:hypothetical protein
MTELLQQAVAGDPGDKGPTVAEAATALPSGVDLSKIQYLMNLAMARARRCHLGGRATGDATIYAAFGPDGHVQQVVIKGEPIASAPVSKCITTHASGVAVKPYQGDAFVIRQGITLR